MNENNYMDWIDSQFTTDEIAEIEQANDDYWRVFCDDELAQMIGV